MFTNSFSCTKGYDISGNDHKKTIRIRPEECEADIHFEDDEVSSQKYKFFTNFTVSAAGADRYRLTKISKDHRNLIQIVIKFKISPLTWILICMWSRYP